MGSSIVTFNTLQLFCKCFTIPLHNNYHTHAPTFLNPVNKCSKSHFTAVFAALSCNSAAQTLDFTNEDDRPSETVLNDGKRLNLVGNNEKGSGISDIEALNLSKNDDNSSEMAVYDGKSRNNGKRFNLGVKKEKGSGISAVEDGKSRNNGKKINLGVRNEKGNNVGAFEALEFRKNVDNPSENGKNDKRFNFGARNDDESSSGVSFFHPSNGIVEGKVSEGVVDGNKGRNNGERFNLESRSVKGNGISGHHGSVERKNSRSDLVERNEKGRGGSSLGDKRVGFDCGRNWEKNGGDSGWSREHGDRNYGKSGGRIHVGKRSEMGNGRLSLKLSGGGGMGGVERSSGSVDFDNDNKGKNGFGVSNRRSIDDKVASGVVSGKGLRRLERILECVALVDESKGEKGLSFSSTRPKDANTSSVDNGNVHGNDSKVKRKRKKLSKKDKDESPQFQLRIGLDMCCKKGDVMGAISLYNSAVKQGVKMEQYQYTVLLYLCSSAATGVVRPSKSGSGTRSLNNDTEEERDDDADDMDDEGLEIKDKNEKLEMNEIRVSDDVKKYALERGLEVYERMCSDKVEMNEAALTSVARMAMAMGNGDMAFDMVIQMKSMGINPRLRSYGPALSVFSSKGELEKAFAVENHMLENGVYPEEPELEALLRVSIQCGKADKVYYVLHKLRTSVRSVSPSTSEMIEKWFRTQQASRVGKRKWDANMLAQTMENVGGGWHGQGWLGSGKWNVSRTSIGADGLCKCCGEKLALIDLDPEETERFAESVASIAIRREKNLSFQKFQRWLDYYGPFEAVVDAANVGLLSQRKFKPSKVNAVVNGIRQLLPSKKWPLIILHNRRVTGSKMEEPINKALVDRWKNADALYATPTGSNDDWYWLYAAIKFKCLLVTNDEMRDHTFQLLGNDFFPKWKERHQVRFNFSEIGPVFYMPPPCSVVIQESNKGLWHVPIASENRSEEDRTWLCISRPKSLGKQVDPDVGADR